MIFKYGCISGSPRIICLMQIPRSVPSPVKSKGGGGGGGL